MLTQISYKRKQRGYRFIMKSFKLPKITNVVTCWDLCRRKPILGISGETKKRFNADIIIEGGMCLLVFESGKVNSTGFKTIVSAGAFVQKHFPLIRSN